MTHSSTPAIAFPEGNRDFEIIPVIRDHFLAWLGAEPRTKTEAVERGPIKRHGSARAYLTHMEAVGLIHWEEQRVNRHGWRRAQVARLGPSPTRLLDDLLESGRDQPWPDAANDEPMTLEDLAELLSTGPEPSSSS